MSRQAVNVVHPDNLATFENPLYENIVIEVRHHIYRFLNDISDMLIDAASKVKDPNANASALNRLLPPLEDKLRDWMERRFEEVPSEDYPDIIINALNGIQIPKSSIININIEPDSDTRDETNTQLEIPISRRDN